MKAFCEDWEKLHSKMEWGKYPSEHVIRFVARNYYNSEERDKVKMLDFGCGAGANTWFLAREGFDIYAFDGAKSAVDKAKRYLFQEGFEKVKFKVLDAVDVDKNYPKDFFDCVIDNLCIYANTLETIKQMYSNIYFVLRSVGKLFTVCFGEKVSGYHSGFELEKGTYKDIQTGVLKERGIVHIFEKSEIQSIIQNAGFKSIEVEEMIYSDKGNIVHMYMVSAVKKENFGE